MSNEKFIDSIYQDCFDAVKDAAVERDGITTNSPHPSVRAFEGKHGSITVQLGEGLIYRVKEDQTSQVSKTEFNEKVSSSESEILQALSEMWYKIGQAQAENLSTEYLERYM